MNDPNLKEVIKACIEDRRLLEIVKNISRMSEEEKSLFRKKMNAYFTSRSSDVDVQAYRFFKFVLEGDNVLRILEGVRENEKSGGR